MAIRRFFVGLQFVRAVELEKMLKNEDLCKQALETSKKRSKPISLPLALHPTYLEPKAQLLLMAAAASPRKTAVAVVFPASLRKWMELASSDGHSRLALPPSMEALQRRRCRMQQRRWECRRASPRQESAREMSPEDGTEIRRPTGKKTGIRAAPILGGGGGGGRSGGCRGGTRGGVGRMRIWRRCIS